VAKSLEFFLRFTCVNIELNSGTPWYRIFRAHGRFDFSKLHFLIFNDHIHIVNCYYLLLLITSMND
jgi:hypothetical protein